MRNLYLNYFFIRILSEFPQYALLKTALEENNSYVGSQLDDCYQCVVKFSIIDQQGYNNNNNNTLNENEGLNNYNLLHYNKTGKSIVVPCYIWLYILIYNNYGK